MTENAETTDAVDLKDSEAVISEAIRRAIENFGGDVGDSGDRMFNAAGFGFHINKLRCVTGSLDGSLVSLILSGRKDVQVLKGGSHYRLIVDKPQRCGLFVIRQLGRKLYWCCSTEHSCGWTEHQPKQAFSKSELSKQVFNMIDRGCWCDIEILELSI